VDISKKPDIKQRLTNFFGGLGYICCATQWLWALLLYFSYIRRIMSLVTPVANVKSVVIAPVIVQPVNPLMFVVGSIILITMITITIFVIVKIPSIIAKTGQKIVHKSTENVIPIILNMQNKKETKRNKIKLSFGLILIFKILLIIIPVILTYMSQFIKDSTFDFYIAMYVSTFLLMISVILFGIQYLLARLFSVNKQDIS